MPLLDHARPTLSTVDARRARDDERPDLWDLIDEVRAGNPAAFGELFDATLGTVYPYVLRRVLGDRHAAEEIVGDVYLAAWRGIQGVRRAAASPEAWLVRIAQHRVIDYHRARQRRPVVPAGAPADLALYRSASAVAGAALTAQPAESICLERDEARALWAYVRQLTAEQCRVIRYRFFFGLSVEETAAALGKHPAAVKTMQYRAMRALRARLAGSSLDPRPAALPAAA